MNGRFIENTITKDLNMCGISILRVVQGVLYVCVNLYVIVNKLIGKEYTNFMKEK